MASTQVENPENGLKLVFIAAALWAVFLGAVAWDFHYIRSSLPQFEAMYEGLGTSLPPTTRFFMEGWPHLLALVAVPALALGAGIAWRLRRGAGIAVLALSVLLAIGWQVAYRHAMRLPVTMLEHLFDDGR